MAALSDEVKRFAVQALACYDTPAQVQKAIKEEFGLEVTKQQLQAYNPATVAGVRMSKKLKDLFEATRQAFLADVSTIPIAQQSFRLRSLNRLHELAVQRGKQTMTQHYSVAQIVELHGALEKIRAESGAWNKSLATLRQEHEARKIADASPRKVPEVRRA